MRLTNVLARLGALRTRASGDRCYCNCDTCKVGYHCRNTETNCDF